jgi:hypothetical protein
MVTTRLKHDCWYIHARGMTYSSRVHTSPSEIFRPRKRSVCNTHTLLVKEFSLPADCTFKCCNVAMLSPCKFNAWVTVQHRALTSELASHSSRLTPGRKIPDNINWTEGWMSPEEVLHTVQKRKTELALLGSEPRLSVIEPVAQSVYWLSCHGSSILHIQQKQQQQQQQAYYKLNH